MTTLQNVSIKYQYIEMVNRLTAFHSVIDYNPIDYVNQVPVQVYKDLQPSTPLLMTTLQNLGITILQSISINYQYIEIVNRLTAFQSIIDYNPIDYFNQVPVQVHKDWQPSTPLLMTTLQNLGIFQVPVQRDGEQILHSGIDHKPTECTNCTYLSSTATGT
jgi:hypothetical protein